MQAEAEESLFLQLAALLGTEPASAADSGHGAGGTEASQSAKFDTDQLVFICARCDNVN